VQLLGPWGPWVVAHCRCGWRQTLQAESSAHNAAHTHIWTTAPDLPVSGPLQDEGGTYYESEAADDVA
jgi:hypothetical protein